MQADRITPVILCGGVGSRLWPQSREVLPKQFLPLFNGHSLFDLTLQRVADRSLFAEPVIVTAEALAPLVSRSLTLAGLKGTLLLEPCRRNTAPAIALALAACGGILGRAPMLVLASDHFIADAAAFRRAVRASLAQARSGRIITFGVEPDTPHTGYGYIEKGQSLGDGISAIAHFIEKPTHDVACGLLAKGCLWNSGNFLFRPDVMHAEITRLQPRIAAVAQRAAEQMSRTECKGSIVLRFAEKIFSAAPDISIDHAVLERSSLGVCKQVNYRWSDMGTWNALWEHHKRDENRNAVMGPATLHDCKGSLVISEAQHVAVLGLDDIAVVVTADAILVAPRRAGREVSELVKNLKADPKTESLVVDRAK